MLYEFKKGDLKKLNDLNQDLKTIFETYILSNSGFIYGESILRKGSHMVKSDFKFFIPCPGGYVFRINSKDLYTAIKDNKKHISQMSLVDNKLYIGNDEKVFQIGVCVKAKFINLHKQFQEYTQLDNVKIDDAKTAEELSNDDVKNLVGGFYIIIKNGKYKTRITKEVIPGLKKSHEVKIDFFDHSKDKSLFFMTITVHRAHCVSYHTYTCIFM